MRLVDAWRRFWFADVSLVRVAAFRVLILTLALHDLIAYSSTAFADAAAVSAGAVVKPWNPIVLFQALGLQPIGSETARVVFAVGALACVTGILGLATRVSCLVAACTCTYWTGLVYSFGKVHHEKVALTFALFALVLAPVGARLSLDAVIARVRRARRGADPREVPERSDLAGVPLRLTQVTMALGYSFAGLTKLAVSGPEWANGYTLMSYCLQYDNALSGFLAQEVWVSRLLSIGALFVQASFVVVLFAPRLAWFYLPSVVLFHLSTWWAMDTGPYVTLWFCGVAFVPLERVPDWLARGWRAGALRCAFTVLLALVVGVGCLWVLYATLPRWTLIASLPLLHALVLRVRAAPRLAVAFDPTSRASRVACALACALDWGSALEWRTAAGLAQRLAVLDPGGKRALVARLPLIAWLAPFFPRS